MSGARNFIEAIAIPRFIAVGAARVINPQRHVFHEKADHRNTNVANHAPQVSVGRTFAALIQRSRATAVFDEVAVPDGLAVFQVRDPMNGTDVRRHVSAGLAIQKNALHLESGERPVGYTALQQRTDLADDVPPQAGLHLGIIASSGLWTCLQGHSGIRHGQSSVPFGVEFLERPDRRRKHGDADRGVAMIHHVIVRCAPVFGEIVPASRTEHVHPHGSAEARRLDGTPEQNTGGVRRVCRTGGDLATGVPVVDIGPAAHEEFLFHIAKGRQIQRSLRVRCGHERPGIGGNRDRTPDTRHRGGHIGSGLAGERADSQDQDCGQ